MFPSRYTFNSYLFYLKKVWFWENDSELTQVSLVVAFNYYFRCTNVVKQINKVPACGLQLLLRLLILFSKLALFNMVDSRQIWLCKFKLITIKSS